LIGLFVTNDSVLNEDQEALVPVPEELLVAWKEHEEFTNCLGHSLRYTEVTPVYFG